MKQRFKSFYLLVSSVVIGLLHLPFAFAKSATGAKLFFHAPADPILKTSSVADPLVPVLRSVYGSLHLSLKGLSQQAFDYAKQGLSILVA